MDGLHSLESVGGNLEIWELQNLNNIEGLRSLKSIGGHLWIWDMPVLSNLEGLDSLRYIGAELDFSYNPSLNDISSLAMLDTIIGGMSFWNCSQIQHIDCFGSLDYCGRIHIYYLPNLLSISNLNSLQNIPGVIYLRYVSKLNDLSGFNALNSIGSDFWLFAVNSIENLNDFSALKSIGGRFRLSENLKLSNILALDSLRYINGDLQITNNPLLQSLSGLDSIRPDSLNDILISGNTLLNTCDVWSICRYISNPMGTIEISDNAQGCNNQMEVEIECGIVQVEEAKASEVSIYPNPAKEFVKIVLPDNYEANSIILYDRLGRVVKHSAYCQTLNVSDIPKGFYIIEVKSKNRIFRTVLSVI